MPHLYREKPARVWGTKAAPLSSESWKVRTLYALTLQSALLFHLKQLCVLAAFSVHLVQFFVQDTGDPERISLGPQSW